MIQECANDCCYVLHNFTTSNWNTVFDWRDKKLINQSANRIQPILKHTSWLTSAIGIWSKAKPDTKSIIMIICLSSIQLFSNYLKMIPVRYLQLALLSYEHMLPYIDAFQANPFHTIKTSNDKKKLIAIYVQRCNWQTRKRNNADISVALIST